MGAGDYSKRVRIEQPIYTTDELNAQVINRWDLFRPAWAAVSPLSSREQMYAKQAQSSVTHKVRMRYFPGLTSAMRIAWEEANGQRRILDISSVFDQDETHVEWQVQAVEQTSGQ